MNRTIELNAREDVEEVIKRLDEKRAVLTSLYEGGKMSGQEAFDFLAYNLDEYSRKKEDLRRDLERAEWRNYDKRVNAIKGKFREDLGL